MTEESKELHFILVGRGGELLLIKGSCFECCLFPFAVLALSDDEGWRDGVYFRYVVWVYYRGFVVG